MKRVVYFVVVVVIAGGLYYVASNIWTAAEHSSLPVSRLIWKWNELNPALGPTRIDSTAETLQAKIGLINAAPRGWATLEVTLLALALLLSLGVNVTLLRTRRRGDFEGMSDQLAGVVQQNEHRFRQLEESIRGLSDQGAERSQALLKAFLQLQGSLDDRDREIERYKKGYDAKILQRFARQLIKFDEEIVAQIEELDERDTNAIEVLTSIQADFRDVLRTEMGVTKFIPEEGKNIREYAGLVSNRYETCTTDDPDAHQTIAKVVKPGWRLEREEGEPEAIEEALVVVFDCPSLTRDVSDGEQWEATSQTIRASEENEVQGKENQSVALLIVCGLVLVVLVALGAILLGIER